MTETKADNAAQVEALRALLDGIDRKTAPALQFDLEFLRASAAQGARERTLHIAFVVGLHEMALPVSAMRELGEMPTITPLPYLPPWIRGIVQIRGDILSVVDFRELFRLPEDRRTYLKQSYILFQEGDMQFCVLANRITGIINVDNEADRLEAFTPEEQTECRRLLPYVRGVLALDRRRVFILKGEELGRADLIRRWRD